MTARADRPGLVSGKKDKIRTEFLLTTNREGEKEPIVAVSLGTVLEVSVDTNLVPVLALLGEMNFSPRMQTFRGVCVATYCALLNVIAHYRALSNLIASLGGRNGVSLSQSLGGRKVGIAEGEDPELAAEGDGCWQVLFDRLDISGGSGGT